MLQFSAWTFLSPLSKLTQVQWLDICSFKNMTSGCSEMFRYSSAVLEADYIHRIALVHQTWMEKFARGLVHLSTRVRRLTWFLQLYSTGTLLVSSCLVDWNLLYIFLSIIIEVCGFQTFWGTVGGNRKCSSKLVFIENHEKPAFAIIAQWKDMLISSTKT